MACNIGVMLELSGSEAHGRSTGAVDIHATAIHMQKEKAACSRTVLDNGISKVVTPSQLLSLPFTAVHMMPLASAPKQLAALSVPVPAQVTESAFEE